MCGQKSSLSDKLERIYAGVLKAAGHETAVQWVFLIGAFEERQDFFPAVIQLQVVPFSGWHEATVHYKNG